MKISNEQIVALQESEARRKNQAPAEGFESLLSEQLGQGQAQGVAPAMDMRSAMLHGLIPATLPQQIAGVNEAAPQVQPALEEAMKQMENMFSGLEGYANQLASKDTTSLRNAYSMLENVSSELASFKAAFPDMEAQQPELAAMMNELDVITRTETFKFNRGDYL